MLTCRYHDGALSCKLAAGLPARELSELLHPGGALDQERCPLLDDLLPALGGSRLDWRAPRERGESLSEVYLLLHYVAETAGEKRVNSAYLQRSARHFAVDRGRTTAGRVRCGSCQQYGWGSRLCTRQGAPYSQELAPDANPKLLDPPCDFFRSRRMPGDEAQSGDPEARAGAEAECVERALELLARGHHTWTALLEEHYLLGRSLRDLARRLGCDRRWLAQELERAQEALGYILEDIC